ncbi:MAG: hypothetical protein AAGF12_14870 [Myxococcota bacterium]
MSAVGVTHPPLPLSERPTGSLATPIACRRKRFVNGLRPVNRRLSSEASFLIVLAGATHCLTERDNA